MRLRHIEVFYAVYTTGSISAAARSLHVSQPSVSKVLHHAQAQLGFELFTLVRGRLVATDEAHALFEEVKEIFERMASLRKTVANIRNIDGGHVRLAVVPSLGLHVAPSAIANYRRRFPEVTFDVQTLHHNDVFQALYERECDVAFAYSPPMHPRMQRHRLGSGELMLLFERTELANPGERVPVSRLAGHEMVGLANSGPIGDLLERELEEQGITIREVVSNQTYYLAAALTRCGAGMSIVDEFTARASATAELEFRPLDPAIRFQIECVYLEDRPPSHVAEAFIEEFRAALDAARPRTAPAPRPARSARRS